MALLTYTSDINVLVAELITLSNRIIVPVKMILWCPQKGYFQNLDKCIRIQNFSLLLPRTYEYRLESMNR